MGLSLEISLKIKTNKHKPTQKSYLIKVKEISNLEEQQIYAI